MAFGVADRMKKKIRKTIDSTCFSAAVMPFARWVEDVGQIQIRGLRVLQVRRSDEK
jgi:hypothetical protein